MKRNSHILPVLNHEIGRSSSRAFQDTASYLLLLPVEREACPQFGHRLPQGPGFTSGRNCLSLRPARRPVRPQGMLTPTCCPATLIPVEKLELGLTKRSPIGKLPLFKDKATILADSRLGVR